jgi:hypothetical protein
MNGWKVGPIERRIAPPIQHAITIYNNNSQIVIYVGVSAFAEIPNDDELDTVTELVTNMSEAIRGALNITGLQ